MIDSARPELMLSEWNRNTSAIVKITHKYDYNGELAGTSNKILDIKEVIQVNSPEQISLFKKDTEEGGPMRTGIA